MASAFANREKRVVIMGSLLVPLVVCAALVWPLGAIAVGASGVVCALFCFVSMKKIGGITGDCVGFANEVVEIAVLFVGVVVVG